MNKNSNVTELQPPREFYDLSGLTLVDRTTGEQVRVIDYVSTQVILVSGSFVPGLNDAHHNDRISFISLASLPKGYRIEWSQMPDSLMPRFNAAIRKAAGNE